MTTETSMSDYANECLNRYSRKVMKMIRFGRDLATLSTDPRISVGCVVFPVDCSAVLGIGYNGAARGVPHSSINTSAPPGSYGSGAAHAEANALIKMQPYLGPCIMFTTLSPCAGCAPLIVNKGNIVCVFHDAEFADEVGARVLAAANVPMFSAKFVEYRDMHQPKNPEVCPGDPILFKLRDLAFRTQGWGSVQEEFNRQ